MSCCAGPSCCLCWHQLRSSVSGCLGPRAYDEEAAEISGPSEDVEEAARVVGLKFVYSSLALSWPCFSLLLTASRSSSSQAAQGTAAPLPASCSLTFDLPNHSIMIVGLCHDGIELMEYQRGFAIFESGYDGQLCAPPQFASRSC